MVELRKRPPPKETATPSPSAKRTTIKKLADRAKVALTGKQGAKATSSAAAVGSASAVNGVGAGMIAVGHSIDLAGFGGTVQTNDGADVTLEQLVQKSAGGVVIFTYPRASTPGCTTQACLFRDNYQPITAASLSVFGLSTDSPKANTTFVTKQKLPYPLLCDPNASLTSAIGMKKPGPGKSTSRGVVVIDKQGVVRVWAQAGPAKTLEAVLDYIKSPGPGGPGERAPEAPAAPLAEPEGSASLATPVPVMDEPPLIKTPSKEEQEAAATAAEVGETAAKLDAAINNIKA